MSKTYTRTNKQTNAHKKNIIISSLRGQNREKIFSVYVCSHGINENLLKRFNLLLLEQDGFAFWNFPSHKAIVWLHKTRRNSAQVVCSFFKVLLLCIFSPFWSSFSPSSHSCSFIKISVNTAKHFLLCSTEQLKSHGFGIDMRASKG